MKTTMRANVLSFSISAVILSLGAGLLATACVAVESVETRSRSANPARSPADGADAGRAAPSKKPASSAPTTNPADPNEVADDEESASRSASDDAPRPPPPPSSPPKTTRAPTDDAGASGNVIRFAQPLLNSPPSDNGHVLFTEAEGRHIFRIEARSGALPVDIDLLLDSVSTGRESAASMSFDGEWLALTTQRFGCTDWECLVLAPVNLSQVEIVRTPQGLVHSPAVVASGATAIAFTEAGGKHSADIFVLRRGADGGWNAPLNVSDGSPFSYNSAPNFSPDGSKVVFDCGPLPYGDPGTSVCEVNVDGSGFRVTLGATPPEADQTSSGPYFHRPSYSADGTVYFESSWPVERVARIARGTGGEENFEPGALSAHVFANDNSPCVLPNGNIASLWLGRPGNELSLHELKIMMPGAKAYFVLIPGQEVFDGGHFCGR